MTTPIAPEPKRRLVSATVHSSGTSVTVDAAQPTPYDVGYSLDGEIRFTDPDVGNPDLLRRALRDIADAIVAGIRT